MLDKKIFHYKTCVGHIMWGVKRTDDVKGSGISVTNSKKLGDFLHVKKREMHV